VNHGIQENLLLDCSALFKKMSFELDAEVKINQIDDSMPPEMPRIVILSKEVILNFGLNRVEIIIKGTRKHARYDGLYVFYKNQLKKMGDLIQDYLNNTHIKENFIGILAPVRYPQDINLSKDYLMSQLYKMFSGEGYPELATFSFKIGLRDNDIYKNYEVSDYEVKTVNVQSSFFNPATVNLEEFPTVEKGVLIVVDVNNKLQLDYNFLSDYSTLINSFFNAIKMQRDIFRIKNIGNE
jgi:hypothetical protein